VLCMVEEEPMAALKMRIPLDNIELPSDRTSGAVSTIGASASGWSWVGGWAGAVVECHVLWTTTVRTTRRYEGRKQKLKRLTWKMLLHLSRSEELSYIKSCRPTRHTQLMPLPANDCIIVP
jgi:hypothetical protein